MYIVRLAMDKVINRNLNKDIARPRSTAVEEASDI